MADTTPTTPSAQRPPDPSTVVVVWVFTLLSVLVLFFFAKAKFFTEGYTDSEGWGYVVVILFLHLIAWGSLWYDGYKRRNNLG